MATNKITTKTQFHLAILFRNINESETKTRKRPSIITESTYNSGKIPVTKHPFKFTEKISEIRHLMLI